MESGKSGEVEISGLTASDYPAIIKGGSVNELSLSRVNIFKFK